MAGTGRFPWARHLRGFDAFNPRDNPLPGRGHRGSGKPEVGRDSNSDLSGSKAELLKNPASRIMSITNL